MFDLRNLSPLKKQRAIAKLTKMANEAPELFVATHLMAEANQFETGPLDNLYKQAMAKCHIKMSSVGATNDDDIALMSAILSHTKWGTFSVDEMMENTFENSAKILVNMKRLPERFIEVGRHCTHDIVA